MKTDTIADNHRPQDLVFTLFGDQLLHRDGAVWVGSLIELMRPLGLTSGAVRTVLSRMSRRGWLTARREGRRSFYDLSARGRALLEAGEARIYHPPRDEPWDGLWYLVWYSIPEDRRWLRDRLRVRLQWLGFGQLGNGLWISPHDVRGAISELASELGIAQYMEIFRAHYDGFSSTEHLVAQCWDVVAIDARYAAFLARYSDDLERSRAQLEAAELHARDAYVRRFRLVHEYREFPLLDPYLPRELLPDSWHGEAAARLFEEYHEVLTAPAESYVASVLRLSKDADQKAAGARGTRGRSSNGKGGRQ